MPHRFIGWPLAIGLLAASCGDVELEQDQNLSDVSTSEPLTYEAYLAEYVEITPQGFVVEDDIIVQNERTLRYLYEQFVGIDDESATVAAPWSTATEGETGPPHEHEPSDDGAAIQTTTSDLVYWNRLPGSPFGTQRRNITYCIQQQLLDTWGTIVEDVMNVGASEWEERVNVNFIYMPQHNQRCSRTSSDVDINVIAGGGASGTFPEPGVQLVLTFGPTEFSIASSSAEGFHNSNANARHELGHILGFVHEHQRDDRESAVVDCESIFQNVVKLTRYDRYSVMHYSRCGNAAPPFRISDSDYRGAISLNGRDTSGDRLVGDFDGDGKDDIMVVGYGWTRLPVYFSQGRSGFRSKVMPLSNTRINAPRARRYVGDFDGDGSDDVVVFEEGFAGFVTYYSEGDGRFTPVVSERDLGSAAQFIAGAETNIIVGRANHDSRTDIVLFAPWSGSIYTVLMPSTRRAVTNLVRYNMPSRRGWLTYGTTAKMEGDFDGDGLMDIALWSEGWASTPVYHARGDGGWTITNIGHPSSKNWINQTWPMRLLGDFDGNNKTDIALWRPGWNTMPIYAASSQRGGFVASNNPTPSYVNERHTVKHVVDLDGRNGDDVVVLDYYNNAYLGALALYSNGNGTFTPYHDRNATRLRDPGAIVLPGDYDDDGKDDLAMWRPSFFNSTTVAFGQSSRGLAMEQRYVLRDAINRPREQLNLLANGDFYRNVTEAWSLRQGFLPQWRASGPAGRNGVLLLDDNTSGVSWVWSDPIVVQEGERLCISADTYKTNVVNGGYPRVWAQFYRTERALWFETVGNNLETWPDNRNAPQNVWAPVKTEFSVPTGIGVKTMRVLLTANSTPRGDLYFDNLAVWERGCPSWVPEPWQPPPPPPPPVDPSCAPDFPDRAECEAAGCSYEQAPGQSYCYCNTSDCGPLP